jgi:hypothetical protein
MEPNPYESPHGTEPQATPNYEPHWGGVAFWTFGTLWPFILLYFAFAEYCAKGFVGGDGMSAAVKWGIILTMYPVLVLCGVHRLWCAFRWKRPESNPLELDP